MFGWKFVKKSALDHNDQLVNQMGKENRRQREAIDRLRGERNEAQERYGRLIETIEAVRRSASPDGPTGDVTNLANALTLAERELAKAKQPSPEMVEAMQRMGRQFAEQVGIDPALLAMGVAVGPMGPIPVRLDLDAEDRMAGDPDCP